MVVPFGFATSLRSSADRGVVPYHFCPQEEPFQPDHRVPHKFDVIADDDDYENSDKS